MARIRAESERIEKLGTVTNGSFLSRLIKKVSYNQHGKMGAVVMLKKPSNKCSRRASLSAVAYPF
jgi:hypothetical protein